MGGGPMDDKDLWSLAAFALFCVGGLTMVFTASPAMFAGGTAASLGVLALVVWQGKT